MKNACRLSHRSRAAPRYGDGPRRYHAAGFFWVPARSLVAATDVVGFNELVDMTAVARLEEASRERVSELAELAASMDIPGVGHKAGDRCEC